MTYCPRLIVTVLSVDSQLWEHSDDLDSKEFKGAVGLADLKISKSALLSLNHHNFSNTKPIYTE